jgi:hypothetical protein
MSNLPQNCRENSLINNGFEFELQQDRVLSEASTETIYLDYLSTFENRSSDGSDALDQLPIPALGDPNDFNQRFGSMEFLLDLNDPQGMV